MRITPPIELEQEIREKRKQNDRRYRKEKAKRKHIKNTRRRNRK